MRVRQFEQSCICSFTTTTYLYTNIFNKPLFWLRGSQNRYFQQKLSNIDSFVKGKNQFESRFIITVHFDTGLK